MPILARSRREALAARWKAREARKDGRSSSKKSSSIAGAEPIQPFAIARATLRSAPTFKLHSKQCASLHEKLAFIDDHGVRDGLIEGIELSAAFYREALREWDAFGPKHRVTVRRISDELCRRAEGLEEWARSIDNNVWVAGALTAEYGRNHARIICAESRAHATEMARVLRASAANLRAKVGRQFDQAARDLVANLAAAWRRNYREEPRHGTGSRFMHLIDVLRAEDVAHLSRKLVRSVLKAQDDESTTLTHHQVKVRRTLAEATRAAKLSPDAEARTRQTISKTMQAPNLVPTPRTKTKRPRTRRKSA